VRQLRNEIHRAVAMAAAGGVITPDLLSPIFAGNVPDPRAPRRARNVTLAAAVERVEREMIEAALQRASGNISQSARALGLTRRGLYLKLERLGIGYKVSSENGY
jgi:DNA-binding NtrC family response regulator